ncbi:hypothetical protein [Nitrosomonas marina]|uniref:DUF4376 domain-containing protein n=1 Tax=Nitrosomonas marina TaxID=917 RepID=A0A1H8G011_9PROT|nr:hypothetical protein [Nitrosomonas marina]SEN37431.1 hypothetical protein SAMN05216325_11579 [Nitrosomonas marina]
MGYAIAADGINWRRVESESDLQAGETFSESIPETPIDHYKLKAAKRITTDFFAEIKAGFVTTQTGIKMDCDIADIQRFKSAYDLAELKGQTVMPVIVDYDNVVHTDIPLTDALAMILELGDHYQTQYIKKQNLRAQIMDPLVTTKPEVDAIVW